MKNIFLIAAFLMLNSANAQQISSNFNSDAENWIVIGDATSAVPNYLIEGGNPGGHVSADDTAAGGVWYWSAPAKFLGNHNTSFGKTLSFDLKQSAITSQFDDVDIMISSGTTTIVFDLADNPGIAWTSYSVTLDTSAAWKIDNISTGELATSEQILEALSNISSLKIRGEYISGPDTGGLDNVILENNILATNSFSTNKLNVFPNPTTGIINLSNSENKYIDRVEIMDSSGKLIFTKTRNTSQIDLSRFLNGIYFFKIFSGKNLFQNKIIKH